LALESQQKHIRLGNSQRGMTGNIQKKTIFKARIMNTENNRDDVEEKFGELSRLKQEERADQTVLGEFTLAVIAGLLASFSAILTTVVEGHTSWRPFWLAICIISVLCAVGLIVQGTRNFSKKRP
jgi:hypothetical protein